MPPVRLASRAAEVAAAARMPALRRADGALGVGVGEASAVERAHAEGDGGRSSWRRARRALERRHARRLRELRLARLHPRRVRRSAPRPPPPPPPSPCRQPAGGGSTPSPPLMAATRLAQRLEHRHWRQQTLALDLRDHLADVANARRLAARAGAPPRAAAERGGRAPSPTTAAWLPRRRQSRGAAVVALLHQLASDVEVPAAALEQQDGAVAKSNCSHSSIAMSSSSAPPRSGRPRSFNAFSRSLASR